MLAALNSDLSASLSYAPLMIESWFFFLLSPLPHTLKVPPPSPCPAMGLGLYGYFLLPIEACWRQGPLASGTAAFGS